ncbi:MAG: ABC transporter permease subunit [Alphaproteobacteria bacterium]|nr:ABC transporter permease subunit [Alphaproteobacteria bacterium]
MQAKSFLELMQWGPQGWLDEMMFATGLTLAVAIVGFLFGLLFGTLAAIAKLSGSRLAKRLADAYTTVFRGVPDLLVIYLFYFGGSAVVTAIGQFFGAQGFIGLPGFLIGTLAIGIVSGAYQSEVIRGAYLAVPPGEVEAARAFGMSGRALLWRIIGPQVLRYGLPGMGNIWQLVLKESALVAVVGLSVYLYEVRLGDLVLIYETRFSDLLRQAHVAAGSTRQPFVFYITAVAFYLVLTTASTWCFRRAETWATRGMRRV